MYVDIVCLNLWAAEEIELTVDGV